MLLNPNKFMKTLQYILPTLKAKTVLLAAALFSLKEKQIGFLHDYIIAFPQQFVHSDLSYRCADFQDLYRNMQHE